VATGPEDGEAAWLHIPRRGWSVFLLLWTVLAGVAVGFLLVLSPITTDGQVIEFHSDGSEPLGTTVRRTLWLVHLSLYRVYPWVLMAPYVVWLAFRFSIESGRLRVGLPVHFAAAGLFVVACEALNQRVASTHPPTVRITIEENRIQTDRVGQVRVRETRMEQVGQRPITPEITDRAQNINDPSDATDAPAEPAEVIESRVEEYRPVAAGSGVLGARGPYLALDLFLFASLSGLGHAWHFQRRFRERERAAAVLEAHLAGARLRALQAQLQPHFLFNTLNAITTLVRQDAAAAEEMLTSLGELLRLALNSSDRHWVSLNEELRFLELYLEIQHARFGDRLRFEQSIDEPTRSCQVPCLLLQPLIENAIRHGMEPSGRPGTLRLTSRLNEDVLEVTVEDNGPGCPALVAGTAKTGVGLANVAARLRAAWGDRARLTFAIGRNGGLMASLCMPATFEAANEPEAPS
jgi:two-component sensor histidine kinase